MESEPAFPLVHWLSQISPYYIEIRRSLRDSHLLKVEMLVPELSFGVLKS